MYIILFLIQVLEQLRRVHGLLKECSKGVLCEQIDNLIVAEGRKNALQL